MEIGGTFIETALVFNGVSFANIDICLGTFLGFATSILFFFVTIVFVLLNGRVDTVLSSRKEAPDLGDMQLGVVSDISWLDVHIDQLTTQRTGAWSKDWIPLISLAEEGNITSE